MADQVWHKILLMMKRKPGMSVEAFRDYYETRHAPFCAQWSNPKSRYFRRYLDPQPHPETGMNELPFDVITELWFEEQADRDRTLAYLTSSVMPDAVIEDEKNLFDRSSFRIVTVTEYETDPSALGKKA
jgi:hypothetical protein